MKANAKWSVLLSVLLLSSCFERDEDPIDPAPDPDPIVEVPKCNIIEVKDDITTPTTWKEGNVYVMRGKNIVVRNTTLTIEAGVTVKMEDSEIRVIGGSVVANGTSDKRIVFTSLADDRYCGDTNGDGNASKAEKGDWKGLILSSGSNQIFKNVDIFYAGQNRGGYYTAVKIDGTVNSFEFNSCRIAHTLFSSAASYNTATAFYAGSYIDNAQRHRLINNAFYDNGKPLLIWTHYTLDTSNKFHNPEDPKVTNSHNGIFLTHSSGGMETSAKWEHTEVPYVLSEALTLFSSQTFTIGENVKVKFKNSGDGISFPTLNQFQYHPSSVFTSYRDDSVGGDTNGDQNTSEPKVGDWKGLYIIKSQEYIAGSQVKYAAKP